MTQEHKHKHRYTPGLVAFNNGWVAAIVSWFSIWRKKRTRRITLKKLYSYSEQNLRDIGLSRCEIIEELGYDPHELEKLSTKATYPNSYFWKGPIKSSSRHKRRR